MSKTTEQIEKLLEVMARLRAPDGCPWDREQTHESIVPALLEEPAELIEAIETKNDSEMLEELGDLLLQVVFHSQLAKERGAFEFNDVVDTITQKLIRRHPHVFGTAHVSGVDVVWEQWERIKKEEKAGTAMERKSALDGIPLGLSALMRAQKVFKKARKAKLLSEGDPADVPTMTTDEMGETLYKLAVLAQQKGWDAETLLRETVRKREGEYRKREQNENDARE